jgi:putative transposase
MRDIPFFNNGYYHLYNRGVDKRKIFLHYNHYKRFIRTMSLILKTGSATERLKSNQSLALKSKVSILAYCLMPNHYHFLVKQTDDFGITQFMHQLNTSYTKFINLNTKRTGRLFEYTFKAKLIETDETLLHVSRYIHLNPLLGKIVDDLDLYPWSSYFIYTGLRNNVFLNTEEILSHYKTSSYKDFVLNHFEYSLMLKDAESNKDEDTLFFSRL